MTELLETVIEAHGGLERWTERDSVSARLVSMARERRGLDRDELHVNLGCLRKCAKVAGI